MRDPNQFQIMVNGQPIKLKDATREQLEQELMRALDVIQVVENVLDPMSRLVGHQISGNNTFVDKITETALA